MISVPEAKKIIIDNTNVLNSITLPLYQATGYTLAADLISEIDVPPFNQSAMDGYAFRFNDYIENQTLTLNGEIPAGETLNFNLNKNDTVRIYTGAMVPEWLDTVIMQEKVTVNENQITLNDTYINIGANIRLKGSQTLKGSLALSKGTKITPGAAGFIAGLGIEKIEVFNLPRINIITTGKELTRPGEKLDNGKVFECNSYSLNAALFLKNIKPVNIETVDDDEIKITDCVKKNLNECDILIVTGGVSVGDYDFVANAFKNCGVTSLFHKVKQKPGKPLYFGKHANTLVFGLPGNPAAVLSCYYQYIAPAINQMSGTEINNSEIIRFPLAQSYIKKEGLTHFLKGKIINNEVKLLQAQESYQMSSFEHADCMVQLDENRSTYEAGDLVEVHFI